MAETGICGSSNDFILPPSSDVSKIEPCNIITLLKDVITLYWNTSVNWNETRNKDLKKKTKDRLAEKYKGNVIVDTKHKLDLKDRANGDKYVLTPTNLVWILNEDEDIADFKKKIIDTFSSHGFTTEISNFSDGEHIKLDSKPISNERTLSSVQVHVRLYHKAKKVMVQGSINAINTWVKHHNSISSTETDITDLVCVLNNKVPDEINGYDQTTGPNQSSKDTVVNPDNGSQEQNPPIQIMTSVQRKQEFSTQSKTQLVPSNQALLLSRMM